MTAHDRSALENEWKKCFERALREMIGKRPGKIDLYKANIACIDLLNAEKNRLAGIKQKIEEHANIEEISYSTIKRYASDFISMIRAGAFLTLILVCSLMGIVHYTFLQPYVFQDVSSLGFYLAYIAALFVLMLLCWNLPRQHYRKKLKACILALQEDMNLYVKGYFEKAGQFATYINLLNRLDYITRYHALLDRAWRTTHRLSQGYLWHKIQIRKHLSKLQIFQGLIDLASSAPRTQEEAPAFTPALHGDQVCDVADCSIYWPQD